MKNYYHIDSRARDAEVIEWDPPPVDFEVIAGIVVQRGPMPAIKPEKSEEKK